VNEAYIGRVSAGQKVEAVMDAYPDTILQAHVIAKIPTASRDKATVRVRIGFDSKDIRILPEMAVKVTFRDAKT
jgi:HlyD family secretion protein